MRRMTGFAAVAVQHRVVVFKYMLLKNYITLGRSGLRVSGLCLGTMTFGTEWGWGADENTSAAIFDRYIEAGGNFVDTADGYTNGKSEEICEVSFASGACETRLSSPPSSASMCSPVIRMRERKRQKECIASAGRIAPASANRLH